MKNEGSAKVNVTRVIGRSIVIFKSFSGNLLWCPVQWSLCTIFYLCFSAGTEHESISFDAYYSWSSHLFALGHGFLISRSEELLLLPLCTVCRGCAYCNRVGECDWNCIPDRTELKKAILLQTKGESVTVITFLLAWLGILSASANVTSPPILMADFFLFFRSFPPIWSLFWSCFLSDGIENSVEDYNSLRMAVVCRL